MSTSATGGYLLPKTTEKPPGNLTLMQFLQTVVVGVSGLPGSMVRPKWQVAPPKQPDIIDNWAAIGIKALTPSPNSYVGLDEDDNNVSYRQETIDLSCSLYGPDAVELSSLIRDGFQIQQNLEALTLANMGFVETTPALHIPDLVNGRFLNRLEMSIILRRQVRRTYSILPILSANGTVHTALGSEEYLMDFNSEDHRE